MDSVIGSADVNRASSGSYTRPFICTRPATESSSWPVKPCVVWLVMLEVTSGTTKAQLHRARKLLRRNLER